MNESNNNDTKDETAYKNQQKLTNDDESSKQTLPDREHDVSKKQSDSTSKGRKKSINKQSNKKGNLLKKNKSQPNLDNLREKASK